LFYNQPPLSPLSGVYRHCDIFVFPVHFITFYFITLRTYFPLAKLSTKDYKSSTDKKTKIKIIGWGEIMKTEKQNSLPFVEWLKWTAMFIVIIGIIVAAITAVAQIETTKIYWMITAPIVSTVAGFLGAYMLRLPSKGS
jgi:general stress protein CsbA